MLAAVLLGAPVHGARVAAAPGDESAETTTTTTTVATETTSTATTTTTTAPEAPEPTTGTTAAPTTTSPAPTTPTTAGPLAPSDDSVVPSATSTTEPGFVILRTPDPTNSIAIDKTNSADPAEVAPGPVQPGDSFEYEFVAECSSINEDCVDLTVVDTFPPA